MSNAADLDAMASAMALEGTRGAPAAAATASVAPAGLTADAPSALATPVSTPAAKQASRDGSSAKPETKRALRTHSLFESSAARTKLLRVLKHDRLWFNCDQRGWTRAKVILNDAEQSLLFFRDGTEVEAVFSLDSESSQDAALLVAGLHEASIDLTHLQDAPTANVLKMDLRGTTCGSDASVAAAPAPATAYHLMLAFASPEQAVGWTAAIKRATFPSGPLWTSRPQHIDEYAMSTLPCPKVGAVWRAEGTKTSVMIDSLRLCSSASLVDSPSNESLLLLLRLKVFGCTLSMDQVLTSGEENPLEVESLKTSTLQELLNFVASCEAANEDLDEVAFQDLIEMIGINVIRPLHVLGDNGKGPGAFRLSASVTSGRSGTRGGAGGRGEEEDPVWTHLALAYELLLKLLSSNVCDLSVKKRCVREELCHEFVQLFRSSNQIERDYVKTIAHCMYSKLVSHRGSMRQAMAHSLLDYVHVSRVHEGVGEMLEVFGSIASGFAVPVKPEHRQMLFRCLLPLHSMPGSENYHEQLSFVLIQYVTKDPDLVIPVVRALLKYWPQRNAAKQILFLGEIGELVACMDPAQFTEVQGPLLKQLCACIGGRHFQVAEYAMGLLNNNSLYALVFDDIDTRAFAYPLLLRALYAAAASWNASVRQIGADILQFLRTLDADLYAACDCDGLIPSSSSSLSSSSDLVRTESGTNWSDSHPEEPQVDEDDSDNDTSNGDSDDRDHDIDHGEENEDKNQIVHMNGEGRPGSLDREAAKHADEARADRLRQYKRQKPSQLATKRESTGVDALGQKAVDYDNQGRAVKNNGFGSDECKASEGCAGAKHQDGPGYHAGEDGLDEEDRERHGFAELSIANKRPSLSHAKVAGPGAPSESSPQHKARCTEIEMD